MSAASIHSASTRKLASEKNNVRLDEDRRQMLDTLKKIRDYKIGPKDQTVGDCLNQ